MDDNAAPDSQVLAAKVDSLFRTVHPEDRGEFTAEEVAAGLRRVGSSTISSTYIWQLRTGRRDNPTKRHLEALAAFFQVLVSYFFDDPVGKRAVAELEALSAPRNAAVRSVALSLAGLEPASLAVISGLVDELRRAHRLPSINA